MEDSCLVKRAALGHQGRVQRRFQPSTSWAEICLYPAPTYTVPGTELGIFRCKQTHSPGRFSVFRNGDSEQPRVRPQWLMQAGNGHRTEIVIRIQLSVILKLMDFFCYYLLIWAKFQELHNYKNGKGIRDHLTPASHFKYKKLNSGKLYLSKSWNHSTKVIG